MSQREHFRSRFGFILISVGCAVGLGNVWRFPYIVGEYGGAAFVFLYILFLVILGLPIMVMEFAVGRASQKSAARSFDALEPAGSQWHRYKWLSIAGNYLLMMFYTTVGGWTLAYLFKMAAGEFEGMGSEQVGEAFSGLLADPVAMIGWMLAITAIGFLVCSLGVQKGIERASKVMMICLFAILVLLAAHAVTLEGGLAGVEFYLIPDFARLFEGGWPGFAEAVYAAMGQAFFTLSLGISSMAIFGSYIGKDRRLTGEAVTVGALDLAVALLAGLVIFPACFAFGVNPGEGPSLVFVTLPNIFGQMWMGRVWGTLFFLFMSFAALSTVIAVFENIIAFTMDQWGWSRKKSVVFNAVTMTVLSLPCALGFNVLAGAEVPGIGNIQAVEDFIVSGNLLPIGSLIYVLFCTRKGGWGWENFLAEANTGDKGMRFPRWAHGWVKYGIPLLIVVIIIMGYIPKFQVWLA